MGLIQDLKNAKIETLKAAGAEEIPEDALERAAEREAEAIASEA